MHALMFIFTAILFFVLTPGIVLSLPPKGSKMMVAMVHAVVFALVFTFTHKLVWEWGISNGLIVKDGFRQGFTGGSNEVAGPATATAAMTASKHAGM